MLCTLSQIQLTLIMITRTHCHSTMMRSIDRILEQEYANVLTHISSTVIFGPFKLCIHWNISFQAHFEILQCNIRMPKQIISRFSSIYSYCEIRPIEHTLSTCYLTNSLFIKNEFV